MQETRRILMWMELKERKREREREKQLEQARE